jgi:Domain of unknown function (DUF222)
MVMVNDIERYDDLGLPEFLEEMEPDVSLAAMVSSVDRTELSDHDVVRLLVARDRLVSHLQAERAAHIAEVVARSSDDDDVVGEFAHLEVGAALRLTRMAAQHEVAFADAVTNRVPRVGVMLGAGIIDLRRARAMVEATDHLPVHNARRVVAEVAERAPGLTTGQLRARLRRLCLTIDPEDITARTKEAVKGRRVVLEATGGGCLMVCVSGRVTTRWEDIDGAGRSGA